VEEVVANAADVVARLAEGRPTDWGQAKGEALVAHYLDATRRPARGRACSARHREKQEAYCGRFVVPVIAGVELRRAEPGALRPDPDPGPHRLGGGPSAPVLFGLVAAGLDEGLLLARQDLMRGVHWAPPVGASDPDLTRGHFVD
jgi:hypothetical protein